MSTFTLTQNDLPYTETIQAYLDRIHHVGGGTLNISSGVYQIGSIQIYSNTTLHLLAGATLLASPQVTDFKIYASTTAELSRQAMIYAIDSHNVSITGQGGTISGNAEHYFSKTKDNYGYRMPQEQRPRLVVFEKCFDVHLQGVTITDSPMWTVHLVSCLRVKISQVTIENSLELPNTDALDIDSCQHVCISDCFISAADDAICIKTTNKQDPKLFSGSDWIKETKYVTIMNCTLRSRSCAFKIGTETHYDVSDIVASNVVIYDTNRGIGIFARDGGHIKRIALSNFSIETDFAAAVHWGKADPITVTVRPRASTGTTEKQEERNSYGSILQLSISNFTITCRGALTFHTSVPSKLKHIQLNNVTVQQLATTNHPDFQKANFGQFDIRPPINPANPNPTHTGQGGLDNAYCIDPETLLPYGVGCYEGGLPVVYCHGVGDDDEYKKMWMQVVNGVYVVERPDPLPEGWNKKKVVFA